MLVKTVHLLTDLINTEYPSNVILHHYNQKTGCIADSFMTYFDVGGTNYTNTTTNVTKAVGVGIYFHCDMSVPWIPEAGKLQNDVPGNFSVRWDDRAFNVSDPSIQALKYAI